MTIDQQVRDRFDRATDGALPEPDLATAIAGGRRRRQRRAATYAAGSLAVAAIAAAVVGPRLGGASEGIDVPVAAPVEDTSFVPGTTIDTDLAAIVAAAVPSLPPPTDVYPSDWSRDGALPDDQFANATEWQLSYDLGPGVELLVYVGKPVPGEGTGVPAGEMKTSSYPVGDPAQEVWFASLLNGADGTIVNAIEEVDAPDRATGRERRVLTDEQTEAIAQAPGLAFPDPVTPPPAP